jgi:hypothetical protein
VDEVDLAPGRDLVMVRFGVGMPSKTYLDDVESNRGGDEYVKTTTSARLIYL